MENSQSDKFIKSELPLLELADDLVAVFDQVNDGIYITDVNRNILYWNKASEHITGYSASEVMGKRCADNILEHTDMAGNKICSTDLCPLHRTIITGQPSKQSLIVKARHKDGGRIVVEVSLSPIRNASGTVTGGLEIFRDVSKKIELEEQKARFFSSLSHELKTPLTSMQGYLDLLLSGDAGSLNTEQQEFIKTIYEQEQKLTAVIDELLEMGRFESTDFSYERNIFNLSPVLNNLARSFETAARSKGLGLEASISSQLLLFGDRERLAQAFSNLISNAVKYTANGTVSIMADYDQNSSEISVQISDTGIGIPTDQQKAIFEMFYRVDNPEIHSRGGTGIGLYIVDRIVQRHEGRIELISAPGKGSTFSVYLPGTDNDYLPEVQ